MKKILLTSCCAVAVCLMGISIASAGKHHKGGYQNTSEPILTIVEVLELQDDTPVKVSGKIVKHQKGDKYHLQDNTGTIVVEIDSQEWNGNTITEEDEVIIYGEVDKDGDSTEIDANSVQKK